MAQTKTSPQRQRIRQLVAVRMKEMGHNASSLARATGDLVSERHVAGYLGGYQTMSDKRIGYLVEALGGIYAVKREVLWNG